MWAARLDPGLGLARRGSAAAACPSGSGVSASSHSSVHAELEHAGGLAGERPRADGVGRRGRQHLLLHHRVGLGLVGGEPHRTAPHALGAERHGGGHLPAAADAAGAEHGHRGDGVDDLGDEDHGADLAGVAAGLGALGDDDVDAGLDVALGVHGLAGEGADEPTLLLHPVDQELRGRAERVGHERGAVGEGDLELRARRVGRERGGAGRGSGPVRPARRRRAARGPRSGGGCRRRTPWRRPG